MTMRENEWSTVLERLAALESAVAELKALPVLAAPAPVETLKKVSSNA